VDKKNNLFVIDNGTDGFTLHQLGTGLMERSFTTGWPLIRRTKQVTFGEDGKIVVGGSDCGTVFVFDRETGAPIDMLRHAPKGMIPVIAVSVL
jgi:hypothetical protein